MSKTISKPVVHLAQTVNQCRIDTNSHQMDRNEIPHDPRHLRLPSGGSKMISESMVCLAQTAHLSCVKISTMSERTEMTYST